MQKPNFDVVETVKSMLSIDIEPVLLPKTPLTTIPIEYKNADENSDVFYNAKAELVKKHSTGIINTVLPKDKVLFQKSNELSLLEYQKVITEFCKLIKEDEDLADVWGYVEIDGLEYAVNVYDMGYPEFYGFVADDDVVFIAIHGSENGDINYDYVIASIIVHSEYFNHVRKVMGIADNTVQVEYSSEPELYSSNVCRAIERVKRELSRKELKECLDNDISYLCAEMRPDFTKRMSEILYKLSDDDQIYIYDCLDDLWLCLLREVAKNKKGYKK